MEYIGSQQHFEDCINDDYELREKYEEEMHKEMEKEYYAEMQKQYQKEMEEDYLNYLK